MKPKLTYANVVSTLCLFLLLGGSAAYAATKLAKNSVGTKQIKNNSITAAKIKNGAITGSKVQLSSLGTVPSAAQATTAANATNAAHADSASVADAIAPPEALRAVGRPGQPPFAPAWENTGLETAPVAFYKDREGVVHLQGTASGNGTEELILTLPAGYAPAANEYFPSIGSSGAFSVVRVSPTGEVVGADKSRAHLDGISWRAGQ
jgi:hypothetical protein